MYEEDKRPFWILKFNQDGSVLGILGFYYNFRNHKAAFLCEYDGPLGVTEEAFRDFRRSTYRKMYKHVSLCSIS